MKTFLLLVVLSVIVLAGCDPKPPAESKPLAPPAPTKPPRIWSDAKLQKAALAMRAAVVDELAISRKALLDRDDKIAGFIDAAADPLLLVQSLSSRLGFLIDRDAFEQEMLSRFESAVLSSGDIESELKGCADRVRAKWSRTLDTLADELKSSGAKLPDEVSAALKTPSISFHAEAAKPAISRQLQRAAVLGASFALAPAISGASLKLLSVFFDGGKWMTRWSSLVAAGVEVVSVLVLDHVGENQLGLRQGAQSSTKEIVVDGVDRVLAETLGSWSSSVDDVLKPFSGDGQ